MNDAVHLSPPSIIGALEAATRESEFSMASDYQTGSLLRTLAATRRRSRILELGTGTGLSAGWMLDGMDSDSRLVSVDDDPRVVDIARKHLGQDPRIEFHVEDGSEFLKNHSGPGYDLIFADTWPGKYRDLDLALGLLVDGGLYVVDDMLPQDNWPQEHFPKVAALIQDLESRPEFLVTKMNWSTGIILVTKRPAS